MRISFIAPVSCVIALVALGFNGARAGEPVVEPAAPTLTLENFTPPMFGDYKVGVPFAIPVGRGVFKIAENESPEPQDRIYINYNFYDDAVGPVAKGDAHRETLGVEKTLFGNASIGLRLPFFQEEHGYYQLDGSSDSWVSDLSIILKYAPIRNSVTGDTLSLGLVVTPPTGQRPRTLFGPKPISIDTTLLQPFVGYIWHRGDFFLQAFHCVMVPADSRDVTFLFNDLGIGYWLLRAQGDSLVTGLIPTFEVHVNTPLNNRDSNHQPGYRDSVDLTAGAHIELKRKVLFGIAAATPVTDFRPFEFEIIANLNFRF